MIIKCRGYEGLLVYLSGDVSFLYANMCSYDWGVIYDLKINTLNGDSATVELKNVYPNEIEIVGGEA